MKKSGIGQTLSPKILKVAYALSDMEIYPAGLRRSTACLTSP